MPYIKQKDRERVSMGFPETPGELNYKITRLIVDYMHNTAEKADYAKLNEIVGVLECCKQEFYRRVVVIHEEIQKDENGDMY